MPNWEEVQTRKVELQRAIIGELSKEEFEVLRKILELETDGRPLAHTAVRSDIRKALRNFIVQEVK